MTEERSSRSIPDEKKYIKQARAGDKEAFRRLVESCQDRLFGLALSMVRNREQAEDLVQEIFIKAYFALESFEGQSGFYTWLYRIASNHCLDYLRKNRPIQISLDRPFSDDSEMTFEDTLKAPFSDDPEAAMETPSEAAALLAALQPDQRLILSLRELEGHSYEELADMLNCPVNMVKSRLNRAREALKSRLCKNVWEHSRQQNRHRKWRKTMITDNEWEHISKKAFPAHSVPAPAFLWTRILSKIEAEETRRSSVWWMQWRWMMRLTFAVASLYHRRILLPVRSLRSAARIRSRGLLHPASSPDHRQQHRHGPG